MDNDSILNVVDERLETIIGAIDGLKINQERIDLAGRLFHRVLDIFDSEVLVDEDGEPANNSSKAKIMLGRTITNWLNGY